VNLRFAKDSKHVYYIMGIAKDIVDVATFEVLDCGDCDTGRGPYLRLRFGFARDKVNVYTHDFHSGKPKVLKGANRDTFVRLAFAYAKDDKDVWVESYRISRADPATFEPIDHWYSKDAKHVYGGSIALPNADPVTFRVLCREPGSNTAADRLHVYFTRDLIVGADPASYEVDEDDPKKGRDRSGMYVRGQRLRSECQAEFLTPAARGVEFGADFALLSLQRAALSDYITAQGAPALKTAAANPKNVRCIHAREEDNPACP
jgi:hypothetical protein